MIGVYIHVPFCTSICSYCDFTKFLYKKEWVKDYLKILKEEIDKYYGGELIKTIYIGGGTPSCLKLDELKELFNILNIFKLEDIYEFTIELNVNDINIDLISFLRTTKVNRISVGVESFNEVNLKFLNRKHNRKQIYSNIALLKDYGYDNINVDLIYALPCEGMIELKEEIRHLIKLDIHHISTYSLIIEPHTYLSVKGLKPISEDLDFKMYKFICESLKKNNFTHYEVSNFSLSGYESVHNMNYWNNGEYFGFGLGATGYINGVRYTNTRDFNKYLKGKYREEELFVSKREMMENEVILGLRKLRGINIREFYNKYKTNIQDRFDIKNPIKKKYLVLENEYLRISEDKIYVMNEVINMILDSKS